MAKIRVESKCPLYDGISITFKAPCGSDAVDGLNIYYNGVSSTFTLRDASGTNLAGRGNIFVTGTYVKVILDTTNHYAYVEGKANTEIYSATITTSWTSSGGYYYQDVTVTGILATDEPIVDISPGSDNASNAKYSECICNVFRITTSANSIRIWATEAISTAFPIRLKVVR